MHRSEITIDLGALRRNVRTLLRALEGAQLWAVVKANGYGHGAVDVAGAALGAGATALCVATVPEGLALRREYPPTRRQQCGGSASARGAVLRRALWDRALRPLAVRHRSGRRRARASPLLAEHARAGQAAHAGREHGLQTRLRRRAADVDRPRARGV